MHKTASEPTAPDLRSRLEAMAEEPYRAFQQKLLPGTDNLLGVRLPKLRRLARELARGDVTAFLAAPPGDTFEEIQLRGMVIGCAPMDEDERFKQIAAFVPHIDNWSVCDSFCAGLSFVRTCAERAWEFLLPYLHAEEEFAVRFGVVMLLWHFLEPPWLPRVLDALDTVCHPGYYARMAVAWAISATYIRSPEETAAYLRRCTLDDFTYRKSLQKIRESHAVPAADKAAIRGWEPSGQHEKRR